MMNRHAIVAVVASLCLAACGNSSAPPPGTDAVDTGAPVPKEIRHVTVISPAPDTLNGTPTTAVPATVFIPAHRRGERFPLIIHSHGWGGSRAKQENSDNLPDGTPLGYFLRIDRQIPKLVADGYAVISFDERGWGDSPSEVKNLHPDYETRDAMAVIDWAVENLPILTDARGDPVIGSMGGSYGGGFQNGLAQLDPRIDAMIPGATWFSYESSLTPNGVIKKNWVGILCTAANGATLGPEVRQSCEDGYWNLGARYQEAQAPEILEFFRQNSWSTCSEPGGFRNHPCRSRPVDVLLIQGQRDVLFPLNEAVNAFDFYRARGGDVRLHSMQGGHINPAIQAPDGRAGCGEYDAFVLYKRWFDAKLKGIGSFDDVPGVCLSLDDRQGAILSDIPRGGDAVVTIADDAPVSVLPGRTVFVPLDGGAISEDGMVLAGIPVAEDLHIEGGVAFIGLAVRRSGASQDPTAPIDEQIVPLRADRSPFPRVELIGVAEQLNPGDVPGVLLMAGHPQFEPTGTVALGPNFGNNSARVSGRFRLPVVRPLRLSAAP